MHAIVVSPREFLVDTLNNEESKDRLNNKILAISMKKARSTSIKKGGLNKGIPVYTIANSKRWEEAKKNFDVIELEDTPILYHLFKKVQKAVEDEFGPITANEECEK